MRCLRRTCAAWCDYAGTASPILDAIAAYLAGYRAAWLSVFAYVLFGTYIGIGALAYDFGFSLLWVCLSTVLIWAGAGAGDPDLGARAAARP